ncbi:putative PEP-binding protein [Gordonia sp. PS3]|uniref:Phosphoenolpyruvate-protein phosphotransferase n=2 Tax=Gordonia sihwensis TaxID=173559 RepID=L7LID4_9ACTN|nr:MULTISPECIES: putative PEP-binding protein [Gordonia]AUH69212.1 phosphoenolpyruvate--protein phosphotransferase [Gordonia sp. YC-JH1]WFN94493.1 PEP-utilizing enzyme [Gordonia sihwensis]GAC60880.1 phosphoenolpyruvate--protein phosphotransferase [Gordonia sihwensis NBRC 108236]
MTEVTSPVPAENPFRADVIVSGTPVVGGLAYGPIIRPAPRPGFDAIDDSPVPEELRDAEMERFTAAAGVVADRLADRASHSTGVAAEVLTATAGLARDRGWATAAGKSIAQGVRAPLAAIAATEQFVEMFTKLGGLMAERVTDLLDVRDRVVAELLGLSEPGIPVPDVPSILLADDLAPADTAGLDPARVIGLGMRLGGPSSHTAIIARQLGIPCVVAAAELDEIPSGAMGYVDGDAGTVGAAPDAGLISDAVTAAATRAAETAAWRGPGRTADGHAVAILANVADGVSARSAAQAPVEGVGLFRTELAFLDRAAEPTVAQQVELYREVIDAFPGRKVVIRTLDAGSDKPLKFVAHSDEPNPAMGVRGNRIVQTYPDIRNNQLDALAEAARDDGRATPWVMAPMIATVDEAREFAARVRERGLVPGVMIEVPSAAILADAILAEVDFVSIGTNDLTQYTMAADRMSPELAALTDPWQPAVLALIQRVGDAGRDQGKPVGVCGEAAADPLLACVLVGMGVTSLSSAPAASAAVGLKLGTVTMDQCRDAASAAIAATSPSQAREAVRAVLAGEV